MVCGCLLAFQQMISASVVGSEILQHTILIELIYADFIHSLDESLDEKNKN